MIESLKIVGVAILAAIVYGVAHDTVTTRVCLEYFTVFHRRIPWVGSEPSALALYWGIAATWWMGAGLGIPLACFARWGRAPHVNAVDLIRPIAWLLVVMAGSAVAVGGCVYVLGQSGLLSLSQRWADRIDASQHAAFLADLWAHNTAYAVGFVGGVCLWGWCVRMRQQRAKSGNGSVPSASVTVRMENPTGTAAGAVDD